MGNSQDSKQDHKEENANNPDWMGINMSLQENLQKPLRTKKSPSQEAPHSAVSLSVFVLHHLDHLLVSLAHFSRKELIKWPRSYGGFTWTHFDDDLVGILESSLAGPIRKKMDPLLAIGYKLVQVWFGI